MPALSKMLGRHLPPYKKLKSWLHSRYNTAKSTIPNSSLGKSPSWGRGLLGNIRETPRSRASYSDLDGNDVERLDPDASPYKTGSTKKAVRTFIASGEHNVIEDDAIHLEVELQQYSRQCNSV